MHPQVIACILVLLAAHFCSTVKARMQLGRNMSLCLSMCPSWQAYKCWFIGGLHLLSSMLHESQTTVTAT